MNDAILNAEEIERLTEIFDGTRIMELVASHEALRARLAETETDFESAESRANDLEALYHGQKEARAAGHAKRRKRRGFSDYDVWTEEVPDPIWDAIRKGWPG